MGNKNSACPLKLAFDDETQKVEKRIMCRVLVLDHPLSVRCNTKTVNLRGEQISYSSSSSFSVKTVSCGTTNWPPDSFIKLDALSRLGKYHFQANVNRCGREVVVGSYSTL